MRATAQQDFQPRKTPVQTRAAVTVGAISEATIQVLLSDGVERLTTTRVAERAGVSVGTLYQYYPNKQSLLFAVLADHLDKVAAAVETACAQARHKPLAEMLRTVVEAFVDAKMERIDISLALYQFAADVGGPALVKRLGLRCSEGARGHASHGAGYRITARQVRHRDDVRRDGRRNAARPRVRSVAGDDSESQAPSRRAVSIVHDGPACQSALRPRPSSTSWPMRKQSLLVNPRIESRALGRIRPQEVERLELTRGRRPQRHHDRRDQEHRRPRHEPRRSARSSPCGRR